MTTIVKDKKVYSAADVSGSKALILSLLNENVETVFGYPGGAIMPIYDVFYDFENSLKHILTRHEQGAIHAAEAYAKVSGKPGVVFATSGPGATNLITGLANAMIDSTPIVCITGQVHSHLLGFDAFQETDVVGISMPVTKWNFQVTNVEEIPEAVAKAFYLAIKGRPGPVLIDITKDAQLDLLNYKYQKVNKVPAFYPFPKVNKESIHQAANLINKAKRPMILAGQGVKISGAEKQLKSFAEKSGIPVAATLLGLSTFPSDHPLYFGMLGMHGNYAPNIKTNEADLLIAIGMRFDDRVTGDTNRYANDAHIIHIDIDHSEINKNISVSVPIITDAGKALKQLIPYIRKRDHTDWVNEFRELKIIESEKVIQKEINPDKGKLRPAEIVNLISQKTRRKSIIVTDVGQHQMTTARYYKFKKSNSFITSGGLGTMGFGLPAAFGASTAKPDKQIILFVGDGGFQMTIQELATIRQHNSNIKIIILNNSFLGMVRQWQELFMDKRYSFTNLQNPDFIKIADGYGINGKRVRKRKELDLALEDMFFDNEPYVLEVEVEKENNVFPMVPSGASVSEIMLEPSVNSNS